MLSRIGVRFSGYDWCYFVLCIFVVVFKDFIYLFDRQRSQAGREADGERGRGAGSPLSREPDVGLIPGLWDHDLS